jgi:hypothetical protein
MTILRIILMCVGVLCMMTSFLFLKHEKLLEQSTKQDLTNIKTIRNIIIDEEDLLLREVKSLQEILVKEAEQEAELITGVFHSDGDGAGAGASAQSRVEINQPATTSSAVSGVSSNIPPVKPAGNAPEQIGLLKCGGKYIDSEVIYWKIVPGDDTCESPITPHHGMHHDRYLSYEYDEGGWNNIRMG